MLTQINPHRSEINVLNHDGEPTRWARRALEDKSMLSMPQKEALQAQIQRQRAMRFPPQACVCDPALTDEQGFCTGCGVGEYTPDTTEIGV